MKTRAVWRMTVALVGFLGFSSSLAQTNMLANGGFETGELAPYATYNNLGAPVTVEVVTACVGAAVPEDVIEGDYCLHIVVPEAGANFYDAGMYDNNHTFEQGKKYTLSCFLKSKSGTVRINMKPEHAADPYEAYNELQVDVTEEWTEFHTTTDVFSSDVSPASATFHYTFGPGDFWIDDIKLYEGDYVPTVVKRKLSAGDPSPGDGSVDVRPDTTLSWEPGPFAATHNVYLGTTFDDVNSADVGSPLLVSQ
ncbi:MAG: carbohydrate binding domain-containing protein, partial [Sedimentisphaerales bacterium]|nr:carbohydrate binding domain-containing protein [Sedimentisphaerales bacterium]